MPRIKLIIEYDGTNYSGWQKQLNAITIQGEIEKALTIIYKERLPVMGAGRTDAGVHALGQVAHCDVPFAENDKLQASLNGLLNNDIVIKQIEDCKFDFHARYDAKTRLYKYVIAKTPSAVNRNFVWVVTYPLNIKSMQVAADLIKNTKNFKSFCKSNSSNISFDCEIFKSQIYKEDDLIIYEIEANRFLYGMVRAIVGTLVQIGSNKLSLESLQKIINLQDRTKILLTAPAKGLFLKRILYES